MQLGVHCSTAGGLHNAFTEAERLDINTFQIFSRSQRQWNVKPLSEEEIKVFKAAHRKSKVGTTFSHCSYLINLGCSDDEIRNKSIIALAEEVQRCTQLGLSYCVLHPGSAGHQPAGEAMKKIAEGLQMVLSTFPKSKVMILLENTAGQGTSVGGTFENLRQVYELTGSKRIGFCIDTCHTFVAGYDIRTERGLESTMKKFDKLLGLKNLKAIHLNDSKGDFNSHLDRHAHIGEGKLGLTAFRFMMKNFPDIPKVLETPKDSPDDDPRNLAILRSLI